MEPLFLEHQKLSGLALANAPDSVAPSAAKATRVQIHVDISFHWRSCSQPARPPCPAHSFSQLPTRAAFPARFYRRAPGGAVNSPVFCLVPRVPNAESTSTTR